MAHKEYRLMKNRQEYEKIRAKDARIKLMIDKLYDQYQRGFINNEFACEFINSVKCRYDAGLSLTYKQISKLEELFERY